jgi:hypothetical protein
MGICCIKGQGADPYAGGHRGKDELDERLDTKASMHSEKNKVKLEQAMTDKQKLEDFNRTGDDAKKLTSAQLAKLNRYQKFEKYFPFYLMDVNGFMHLVREGSKSKNLWRIQTISLSAMAEAFKNHDSWKDLQNSESKFVQFLKEVCGDDEDAEKLSIFKLRLVGLLWCLGDPLEKATELYECMQDHDAPKISADDKDFKPNLFKLLDFATEMVFDHESKIMGKERTISEDAVKAAQDKYDDMADEMLDQIFGEEARLTRKDWELEVSKKLAWLFNPNDIRKKLGWAESDMVK